MHKGNIVLGKGPFSDTYCELCVSIKVKVNTHFSQIVLRHFIFKDNFGTYIQRGPFKIITPTKFGPNLPLLDFIFFIYLHVVILGFGLQVGFDVNLFQKRMFFAPQISIKLEIYHASNTKIELNAHL